MPETSEFVTHDLGFAAYLKLCSFELLSAKRENGLFWFTFSDPEKKAEKLRLMYVNSDFARFDSEVKHLKKLLSVS